ncbi:MAG: peptide deformylase [Candidatus Makana argininalis]
MSIFKILQYPDLKLRKISNVVDLINNNIRIIINNMFETMYHFNGIGLAATQVNINKRIIIIDILKKKNSKLVLINPEIIKTKGIIKSHEGCLSIPNISGSVTRYKNIKLKAKNYKGKYFELYACNLLSICIQHEIDHLIGKLFIDYFNKKFLKNNILNINKKLN